MKKVALVIAALALAAPVFAVPPPPMPMQGSIMQSAVVGNNVTLTGTSGNVVTGSVKDSTVESGAVYVSATVQNQANTISVDCHCIKGDKISQSAFANNLVKLTGASGNVVYGSLSKDSLVYSGTVTVTGLVTNMVNTVGITE